MSSTTDFFNPPSCQLRHTLRLSTTGSPMQTLPAGPRNNGYCRKVRHSHELWPHLHVSADDKSFALKWNNVRFSLVADCQTSIWVKKVNYVRLTANGIVLCGFFFSPETVSTAGRSFLVTVAENFHFKSFINLKTKIHTLCNALSSTVLNCGSVLSCGSVLNRTKDHGSPLQ